MKRLTDKHRDLCLSCELCIDDECDHLNHSELCSNAKRYKRLADIEDILGDDYNLDRLRELLQADREKRCFVFPKDGMVYYIEEACGEKWIANKPIQQVTVKCGWGIASIEFSLFDTGKYFNREAAETVLKGKQDGKED